MKRFDVAELLGVSDMSVHLQKVRDELALATTTDNPALSHPIGRLVNARSKRLRSMLVIAVAASRNKEIDEHVISGCVAIELIHLASLVHDDIIDNADTRWSIPTVNAKEGINQAILVGDSLLAKAGEVAATIDADAARLVSATLAELVDGESREVADEFNLDRTIESMNTAIQGKSAALIAAACRMGGICTNAEDDELQAYTDFGRSFGMAFQLVDDLLDLISTEELLGKPVGNDIKEGVYTLPVLLTLQSPDAEKVREILKSDDPDHEELIQLIQENASINKTLSEIRKYNEQAADALKNLPNTAPLANLPSAYTDWALTNLTLQPIND